MSTVDFPKEFRSILILVLVAETAFFFDRILLFIFIAEGGKLKMEM